MQGTRLDRTGSLLAAWVNKGMYVAFPREVGFVCMSLNNISNVWNRSLEWRFHSASLNPYSLSIGMHYRGLTTPPLMSLSHDGTKPTNSSDRRRIMHG